MNRHVVGAIVFGCLAWAMALVAILAWQYAHDLRSIVMAAILALAFVGGSIAEWRIHRSKTLEAV